MATEGAMVEDDNVESSTRDEDENDEEEPEATELMMGGPMETPCFGLLDGIHEDPDTGAKTRVTIPITRLPATLGRSHETEDEHFFGLGRKKALSRKQCMISYRDAQGGKVEWNKGSEELIYKNPKPDDDDANLKTEAELPARGFFVIQCLGKNRILVNQERVEQGDAAVLESGTAIRISSYMLYFMQPNDATPKTHVIATSPSKKRKSPDPAPSSSNAAAAKKSKTTMGANYQAELDALPVETLLERMTDAIDNNEWERRHQLIGATIALHAVRDSAKDPEIQTVALDGGISRSEIMTWMEESKKYKAWVQQMLSKMEARSYQAAVTKCLLKAGFTRTGSSGRYIKWLLPKDISIVVTKKTKKSGEKIKEEKEEPEDEEEEAEDGDEEEEEEEVDGGGGGGIDEDEEEEDGEEEEEEGGENEEEKEEEEQAMERGENEDDADKSREVDGGESLDEDSDSELERSGPPDGADQDKEETGAE